jgi:hypothetical protein
VSEVTCTLDAVHQGDAKAAAQLLALVYDESRPEKKRSILILRAAEMAHLFSE